MINTAHHCALCADADFRALADAVICSDIDRAIGLGLLSFEMPLGGCDHCQTQAASIGLARDARRCALEARERYRKREARQQRRVETRQQKRAAALHSDSAKSGNVAPTIATADNMPITAVNKAVHEPNQSPRLATTSSGLPPAAAAALARAKARASGQS